MKITKQDIQNKLKPARRHRVGEELVFFCPNCGDNDHTGHLYYNPLRESYYCFKCHIGGYLANRPIIRILPKLEDIPLDEIKLPKGFMPIWKMNEIETNTHIYLKDFLQKKKLNGEIIFRMQLYFSPYRQAIIIPIIINGITVSGQVRNLIHEPKYYPLKNTHPSKYLYNMDKATQYSTIILTEGPFDTIHLENTIALLGTSVTKHQFLWLNHIKPNIILLFFDGNAQIDAYKVSNKLSEITNNIRIIDPKLSGNRGPGNMSKREFIKLLFQAKKPSLSNALTAQLFNNPVKLQSTLT